MFKKLFGGGSSGQDKAKAQQQNPVDTQQTMEKLTNQIESVDKRAKVLENKVRDLKTEALAKKKAKDQRGKLNSDIFIFYNFKSFQYNLSSFSDVSILFLETYRDLTCFCLGALHALKQSKMFEKELTKIDGMRTLLTQQKIMIESKPRNV